MCRNSRLPQSRRKPAIMVGNVHDLLVWSGSRSFRITLNRQGENVGMSTSVAKRSVVAIVVAVVAFAGCARNPQEKAARFINRGKNHLKNKDYARALLEFR